MPLHMPSTTHCLLGISIQYSKQADTAAIQPQDPAISSQQSSTTTILALPHKEVGCDFYKPY